MNVVRPWALGRVVPTAPSASAAAQLFARIVVPLVVAVAVVGLTVWLLLIDPVSVAYAAVVVAIPWVVVWLTRAKY
jgi:hypothetical protein